MDLSAVERSAGDVSLETVDDLFREWRRSEADAETVTRVLRCLRAALALDALGEVRHHFARAHGETFAHLARGVLALQPQTELARGRCLLQARVVRALLAEGTLAPC